MKRIRPTMSGILRVVVLVATAMLAVAALAQEVRRGGVLVESHNQATDSLDPHVASSRSNVWMSMLFDTMLGYHYDTGSGTFQIAPALAANYEVINPLTLEFQLREGVVFHDGSAWNAEVARWNIERAINHPDSVVKETLAGVTNVEVIDDLTIRLHLSSPQPLLLLQLTPANNIGIWFISKEAAEAVGDEQFGRAPVGSGPFKLQRWVPDDRLELVAVDGHWELGADGQALPYVNAYTWRFITDASVASLELRSGEVNVYFGPSQSSLSVLANDPNTKWQVQPSRYTGRPSFYFNPRTDNPSPFSQDVRLRLAVQHAIDREAMSAALGFGSAEPHYQFSFYPGMPGYDADLIYGYDPELARSLLAEAGYPTGLPLEVKVINRAEDVQPLEIMQAMLAEVGIDLTIRMMDRLEWIADGNSGDFEALSHGNSSHPSALLRQESISGSQYNWAGYSNAEVDSLWRQAASEYDEGLRNEALRQIQSIVFNDAYHLIGYRLPSTVGLKRNVNGVTTMYNLRYAWLD